jgi:hypothetical protein
MNLHNVWMGQASANLSLKGWSDQVLHLTVMHRQDMDRYMAFA